MSLSLPAQACSAGSDPYSRSSGTGLWPSCAVRERLRADTLRVHATQQVCVEQPVQLRFTDSRSEGTALNIRTLRPDPPHAMGLPRPVSKVSVRPQPLSNNIV